MSDDWLDTQIEHLFKKGPIYPFMFIYKGGTYRANGPGDCTILEGGCQEHLNEFIERCKDVVKNNS
jgi:hypothetical protein